MSKKLGYKPATARKDDMGFYSPGSGATKPRPSGKKIGMDKKLKKLVKRMIKNG